MFQRKGIIVGIKIICFEENLVRSYKHLTKFTFLTSFLPPTRESILDFSIFDLTTPFNTEFLHFFLGGTQHITAISLLFVQFKFETLQFIPFFAVSYYFLQLVQL